VNSLRKGGGNWVGYLIASSCDGYITLVYQDQYIDAEFVLGSCRQDGQRVQRNYREARNFIEQSSPTYPAGKSMVNTFKRSLPQTAEDEADVVDDEVDKMRGTPAWLINLPRCLT
jgi:hypothetical protein